MKQIAVTGGLGFIGTNLIPRLISAMGVRIRILDNLSNPSGDLILADGIDLIEGDIRSPERVEELVNGVDAVIHLAAHTRVMDSIEDPAVNFETNCIGTFNVLEAVRKHGIAHFVNASTGGAILGEATPPIHEDIVAKPASPYGASKLAVEGYCWAYAQSYGLKATSLRFSNIYGPHSSHKGSVVAAFIKSIRQQGEITVYGDGTQTRDYLYVDDLIDGIIGAIRADVSGVYQLGAGVGTSINELIDVIRRVSCRTFDVRYEPFRDGEIRHTWCDIKKARNEFGYSPGTSLEEGVRRTWQWFEQQPQ